MKFETIVKYLVDKIRSDLDDIESIANRPEVPLDISVRIREMIGCVEEKLDMITE